MRNMTFAIAIAGLLASSPPALADTPEPTRSDMTIAGMSCDGCADSVVEAVEKLAGVTSANVDISARRLVVVYAADRVTLARIHQTITDLGYVIGDEDPPIRYPEGADVATLSRAGEDVDVTKHLARGKITIVDFYADWCKPCKALERRIATMVTRTPGQLAVRRINIVTWDTPVAKRYLKQVPGLPYVRIYDRRGRLAASLSRDEVSKLDREIAKLRKR